ncbi:MAG: hypothetical protein LBH58_13510 [Tannerellaceae bacterium]|jgi:hypothetical protein|nr:hypothetical protein [Tannerellaceae bacterium]
MDNLGDWLYILILIAAGISSLISAGKKRTRQSSKQPTPDPEYDNQDTRKPKSFWELLDEEMKKSSTPQAPPQPAPRPIRTENRKKTQLKPSVPTTFTEGEKAIKDSMYNWASPTRNQQEDEDYSLSGESLHEIDELKKAVIYSEILNRKY